MGVYACRNGKVVPCRMKCGEDHQHYVGTFDGALKHFDVEAQDGRGKLMNIIVYHQTSERTFPKLSNELMEILMDAQGELKYYAPQQDRKRNAMNVLNEAVKAGLVDDDGLLRVLERSPRQASQRRAYLFHQWADHQ